MKYFFIPAVAFLITFLLTPTIRYAALKFYVIDKINQRKIHTKIVTKSGGLSIYLGFLGGLLVLVLFDFNFLRSNFSLLIGLVICSSLMLLLGMYDDFHGSGAFLKITIQFIISLLVVKIGFILKGIHICGYFDIEFGILGIPFTVLWILWITNAVNLLDGLDGLAAGVIGIASFFIFLNGLIKGDSLVAFIALALAGANLAFLKYNFYPAKIFMGDTGSLFLGLIMAFLGLYRNNPGDLYNAYFIPTFLVLLLPILDTVFAVARRILRKQHIFKGDSSHIHHYYIKHGFTQVVTVKRFYFMTFALGIVSLLFVYFQ